METHPKVVYVPTSGTPSNSQDTLLEHQISQVRENRIRERSIQTDTMLDLPPQIAISKDGEEGYIESQKHLMFKRSRYLDHVFRPPPNRTVHDRESPPPYYSNSSSLENLENSTSSARIDRDLRTTPKRLSEDKTHHRTLSNRGERTRTVSASSFSSNTKQTVDESPDYGETSDINRVRPDADNNV